MGFTSTAVTPDSVVSTFSGGEKQGVAIIRALYFKAELIILDEPTMGLSLSETRKMTGICAAISATPARPASSSTTTSSTSTRWPIGSSCSTAEVAGEFMTKDITLDQLMERCTAWPRQAAWTEQEDTAHDFERR